MGLQAKETKDLRIEECKKRIEMFKVEISRYEKIIEGLEKEKNE